VTIVNDACTIVQASFTIITYDRQNIFITQATALSKGATTLGIMTHLPQGSWVMNTSGNLRRGYTSWFAGVIHGKERVIQVLAGLAPLSQIMGSLPKVIHQQAKHSSW